MKINGINQNLSFKRVIKVNSATSPLPSRSQKTIDKCTLEVNNVLNNKKSHYNKEQEEKIRQFFKAVLGDYTGENPVLMRQNRNGHLFLISGQDAYDVLEIEAKNSSKNKGDNKKIKKVWELISQRSENGGNSKPESIFTFSSSKINPECLTPKQLHGEKPIYAKLNYFSYSTYSNTYREIQDGHIKKDTNYNNIPSGKNIANNVYYEIKELKF